ncbi:MAG: hypothetical protein HYU28_06695 [Actinobacteria bacterium]|nr:hypothetical protein [Actinomycetota bacterium]
MRRVVSIGAVFVFVLAAACGDGDDSSEAVDKAIDEALDEAEEELGDGEELDVDDCTLLTNEEVSDLAGTDLASTEDSFLGCGWAEEGEVVADFSIRSFRSDAGVAEYSKELAPDAKLVEIAGVGEEAAGLVGTDDEVNFLVARDGDLFVEMVMTFLDVPPDSENFEKAKELAKKALERLAEAA